MWEVNKPLSIRTFKMSRSILLEQILKTKQKEDVVVMYWNILFYWKTYERQKRLPIPHNYDHLKKNFKHLKSFFILSVYWKKLLIK